MLAQIYIRVEPIHANQITLSKHCVLEYINYQFKLEVVLFRCIPNMVLPMRYKYDTGVFENVHLLNMQIVRYDGDIKLQFMPEILINQYMLGILIAYEFINNFGKKQKKTVHFKHTLYSENSDVA